MAGAVTPAAFDPKPIGLGTVIDMIAGAAILSGDVVAFKSTSTEDWTVYSADSDGTGNGAPIGVALHSASTGQYVSVAAYGSLILVREGNTTAMSAGVQLKPHTVAGCVVPAITANSGGAESLVIGTSITSGGAAGTFYMLVNGPHLKPKGKA